MINKNILLSLFLGIFLIGIASAWSASLNNKILYYWDFEDGGGTNVENIANGSYGNGTTQNMEAGDWVAGKVGTGALRFSGDNDWVNITGNVMDTSKLTGNFSYACWIKGNYSDTHTYQVLGSMQAGAPYNGSVIGTTGVGGKGFGYSGGSFGSEVGTSSMTNNSWQLLVYTVNATGTGTASTFLYINNNLERSGTTTLNAKTNMESLIMGMDYSKTYFTNATVDECGIWNRSLSSTEVGYLWNNGEGTTFGGSAGADLIDVILSIPANETDWSGEINFSSNMTMSANINLNNVTLYIWNSSLDIFNKTTNVTINYKLNNSDFKVENFNSDDYHWNTYACGTNATGVMCFWAPSNRTFYWRPFTIDSQTFNMNVSETSYQYFELNITTIPSILSATAKLFYNGTNYTAVSSCDSGLCTVYRRMDVPLVVPTAEIENRSFYWNLILYDGVASYYFDTTSEIKWQNVNRIHLTMCNTTYTTRTLNFTVWDEQNLSAVRDFEIGGTFDSWLGNGSITRNSSFYNATTNETTICMSPTNETFKTDAIIEYGSGTSNLTYVTRNYYFDGASLTNVSQNISLYLLDAEESTSFIIKVQDQKLSDVENAFVYIQRYYPSDGLYRTVQMAKTDDNGESIGFYEAEVPDYKHIIIKNGEVLLSTSPQKVVGKEVPYTLTFTVGDSLTYPWSPWEDNPNIQTSLTYNDTNKFVTFTYIDTTGATTVGRLLITRESPNNQTIQVIYNASANLASATLEKNMSGYDGTFIARGILEEDEVVELLNFLITTARDIFGNTGVILSFFIILTAGLAFLWNPTAGIVGVNAALWFVSLLGLIVLSPIFLFAILGVSILAIILLKT